MESTTKPSRRLTKTQRDALIYLRSGGRIYQEILGTTNGAPDLGPMRSEHGFVLRRDTYARIAQYMTYTSDLGDRRTWRIRLEFKAVGTIPELDGKGNRQ